MALDVGTIALSKSEQVYEPDLLSSAIGDSESINND